MKEFKHLKAATVAEASSMLAQYKGKAALISGGTDIVTVIKSDIFPDFPQAVIDVKGIAGLDSIKEENNVLKLGAMARLADVANSDVVKGGYPSLAKAYLTTAHPQIRNMARVGGNICQAVRCWYYRYPHTMGGRFPCFRKGGTLCYAVAGDHRYHSILEGQVCFAVCASDAATALSALNATVVTNKRSIKFDDFYVVLGTILAQDEIVTEVQVPKPKASTKQTYTKLSTRKAIDWALVSIATAITVEGGTVTDARITLGGVAPMPYRAKGAEDAIKGKAISDAVAAAAGDAAVATAIPMISGDGPTNKYKVQMAKTLVKRAILA